MGDYTDSFLFSSVFISYCPYSFSCMMSNKSFTCLLFSYDTFHTVIEKFSINFICLSNFVLPVFFILLDFLDIESFCNLRIKICKGPRVTVCKFLFFSVVCKRLITSLILLCEDLNKIFSSYFTVLDFFRKVLLFVCSFGKGSVSMVLLLFLEFTLLNFSVDHYIFSYVENCLLFY